MERNRDLRRQAVSSVNGLPRGRKRICTLRDQTGQDRRMELQETVRLGGDKREFPKRRKTDWSAVQQKSDDGERYRENSTDSSDEEDYEMEEDMSIHRTNQLSPPSSSLPINRRGLRTLRSSPVLGAAVNEFFGGPVPRRARSSSAKRLHEYCNSGSSGLSEELNRRRFSPAPVGLIGSGDSLRKMRSVERRTTQIINPSEHPVVQDDIEIEVAEALFDLMKQSQSQSRSNSLQRQVERDSVIPASDASKADGGKDENNAFSVQNEQSIKVNGETVLADPMNGLKEEETVEKKRFPDDSVRDLESGDGFVKKVKVGSPKESESPSCVKVNACDIQHPTMTKAHYDAIIVEAKKETKPEIDLMASPLISSPERKGLVDMRLDPGTMAQAVPKRGEITPLSMLDVEKHNHDTTYNGRKEHKNQSPTFLLPFPDGMGGWPNVPHPGHMPPLPVNGSLKSSMMMQPPPFKFSASRPKKCATHQYLAQSMHCHQQLIKKSLSSDLSLCRAKSSPNLKYTYPAQNLIPGNPLMGDFQGGQNLAMASVGCGKDKSSDAAVAFNAMTSSMPLLQQASHPASASSFLGTMMAPTNSSGSPQSASLLSNSAGRFPINLSLPNASTTMSSNLPVFPSNEAASYFHNNGCSVPISTDIALPSFRGTPNAALNPSLYPSPPFSDMQNQQLVTTSHASLQSASQNTNLLSHTGARISETKYPTSATSNSQPEKLFQPSSKSDTVANWKNGASGPVSHSVKPSNLQTRSSSAQPMHFAMIPPVSVGGDGGCSKPIDPPQQGSKGRVELIPQAFALSFGSNSSATPMLNFSSMAPTCAMFQMLPDMSRSGNQMIQHKNFQTSEGKYSASGGEYSKSDCSEISALSTPKFDGLARNFSFLPSDSQPFQMSPAALSSGFQQHQLIQIQDFHMHQKQLAGTGQVKSSAPHNIPGSFFASGSQVSAPKDSLSFHQKWENFPRSEGSPQLKTSQGQSLVNFGNGPMSATSFQGHQFMIKNDSMSSPIVGSSSSSSFSRSSQRNASSLGLAASTTTSVLPS